MLKRTKYFIGGLLIALTVGAIAQTGGLPSRPRFLSVGVGTAAPSTNGNVNVSGSVTASNFVGNIGGVAPSDFARLSQANTFTANPQIVKADAELRVIDTGGSISTRLMSGGGTGGGLVGTVSNHKLEIRTNNSVRATFAADGSSINLQATNVQVNGNLNVSGNVTASNFVGDVGGVAPSDFARLSQANVFNTEQTITNAAPVLTWIETGVTADNRRWRLFADAERFAGSVVNDANSAATNWITVDRTNNTVDSINLQATNVQVNGSEVCRQNGTGCPSAGITEVVDSSHVWTVQSCTTSPTITPVFIKHGSTVTVRIPNVQCTANAGVSVFQLTGTYPTGMTPNANAFQWSAVMQNNGTNVQGIFRMSTSNWQWIPLSGGTLSGTIGNQAASNSAHMSFTYTIN